ncbi:unnamed protein product, partial [marine sediment metagenome]
IIINKNKKLDLEENNGKGQLHLLHIVVIYQNKNS